MAEPLAPELTIVILCRDEERAITHCIDQAQGFLKRRAVCGEVLVVDNGSRDRSAVLAHEAGARVVSEPRAGYGNAARTGIEAALGRFIILGDGDGELDFGTLDQFVDKLQDGFDLVVGNRFQGGIDPGAAPFLHRRIGNLLLSGVGKLLFRAPVGDFHCGLRAFSATAVRTLRLQSAGFEATSEMIVKAVQKHMRVAEVPVIQRCAFDPNRVSHLRPWRDGWRTLCLLLMLSPAWLFLYPGWMLLAAGALATLVSVVEHAEEGVRFGASTMLFGAAFCILGTQLAGCYLSARAFSESAGLIEGRSQALLRDYHVLETCLAIGFVLTAAGGAVGVWSLFVWEDGGEADSRLPLLIVAVTLMTIGVQTAFQGFLLALIAGQRDGRANG